MTQLVHLEPRLLRRSVKDGVWSFTRGAVTDLAPQSISCCVNAREHSAPSVIEWQVGSKKGLSRKTYGSPGGVSRLLNS